MGLGRIIGKMAKAVAPVVEQNWRDKVEAQKLETLQQYKREDQASDQSFTAGQNKLTRDQNDTQFNARMNQDTTQFDQRLAADTAESGARIQLSRDELNAQNSNRSATLALDARRVSAAVDQANQALEMGNIEMADKRQIQTLRNQAIDMNTDEATRARAIDALETLLGTSNRNNAYESFTSYGEPDMSGEPTRQTGILNRRTGQVAPATLPSAPKADNASDPLGIR